MKNYVQYGCGLCAPDSWRNFDVSPTLRLQKLPLIGSILASAGIGPKWPQNVEYGNITKGLPIRAKSCNAIYCSHVLEHLALTDFRKALQNTYSYLAEDGIFRFVLPDLKRMAENYISSEDPEAAIQFINSTRMGLKKRPQGIKAIAWALWRNSGHRWLWDYKAMKSELEAVGFKSIHRAYYNDSQDPRFSEVEDENRWRGELGVECKK